MKVPGVIVRTGGCTSSAASNATHPAASQTLFRQVRRSLPQSERPPFSSREPDVYPPRPRSADLAPRAWLGCNSTRSASFRRAGLYARFQSDHLVPLLYHFSFFALGFSAALSIPVSFIPVSIQLDTFLQRNGRSTCSRHQARQGA